MENFRLIVYILSGIAIIAGVVINAYTLNEQGLVRSIIAFICYLIATYII